MPHPLGRAVPLDVRVAPTKNSVVTDCLGDCPPDSPVREVHAKRTFWCVCSRDVAGYSSQRYFTGGSAKRDPAHAKSQVNLKKAAIAVVSQVLKISVRWDRNGVLIRNRSGGNPRIIVNFASA